MYNYSLFVKIPYSGVSVFPEVYRSVKILKMSGDQKLSFWLQSQLSAFEQKFTDADKDKSGSLSYDEVVEVLKTAGFKGTDEQYQVCFSTLTFLLSLRLYFLSNTELFQRE